MTRKFIVTVVRIVETEIEVEALSAKEARQTILNYGPDLAAVDMAGQDVNASSKICSVREAVQ
jgi:hypothetical protein